MYQVNDLIVKGLVNQNVSLSNSHGKRFYSMVTVKVAAHLFRSDRNRRVRTEQKCLKEIEYTLFYLTAHTSSDQTGTDASDHIRTEAEFFERYFF